MEISKCACGNVAEFITDNTIFARQDYGSRSPRPIASQDHGYQVRCIMCGLQTCWWHLKDEAISAWNDLKEFINRPPNKEGEQEE